MRDIHRYAWLAMLSPIVYAAEPPRVLIPEVESTPLLLDGRFDATEWRGALKLDIADGLRLRVKQSQGHVYLAVDTPGTSSQPMDLSLQPTDGHVYQLHASMQIAERTPTRDQPEPEWRWGNHVDWLASEMKRDPAADAKAQFSEQLHPADGTEFQIMRRRFPGETWRVRLTVDAVPGSPGAFVYPRGARADDPRSWAIWQMTAPDRSSAAAESHP